MAPAFLFSGVLFIARLELAVHLLRDDFCEHLHRLVVVELIYVFHATLFETDSHLAKVVNFGFLHFAFRLIFPEIKVENHK